MMMPQQMQNNGFAFAPQQQPLQQQPLQQQQQSVPDPAASKSKKELKVCTIPEHLRTTVMIRNVPNQYTREQLERALGAVGYWGSFDFLYLPMDFVHQANVGYAFVNFSQPQMAARFMREFTGFDQWEVPSVKVAEVCWGLPHQGLEQHIEWYRNSPVMHASMP